MSTFLLTLTATVACLALVISASENGSQPQIHRVSSRKEGAHQFQSRDLPSNKTLKSARRQRNGSTPLGHPCQRTEECANWGLCLENEYWKEEEVNLLLRVCQCNSTNMQRIGNSCFVKPGKECYFPDAGILLPCHPASECRSLPTLEERSYCMCKDESFEQNEPFRDLNPKEEMTRCSASRVQFCVSTFLFLTLLFAFTFKYYKITC